MPGDQQQTEQLTGSTRGPSTVAQATLPEPLPAGASPDAAADPMAPTLSMRPKGGVPAAAAVEPAGVGRELGAVRLLREVGRGATGAVFLGHHTVLGRDVAVKFLLNVRSSPQDPVGLKRFLDEARAAAAVRHPHLTQIYHADVDDADGTPYLVLEYVRGPTLKELLDRAGPLDLAAAVAIVCDAAAAVHELHAQGLIHRDIKPSNVLLDGDAHVYVTDFGLALRRSHGAGGAAAGGASGCLSDFAGTPAYMAPEIFDGRVSPRGDVYALGVMTFQLLTGGVPFSGPFEELRDQHARQPLPSDDLRARGVGPEMIEVLERCTNKQPMFRYKTPLDLARALKQAAGCDAAVMARARKRLCDLIAGRDGSTGAAASEPATGLTAGPAEDDGPSTTTYPDMLARFATIRRERRSHSGGDADGSSAASGSTVFRAVSVPEGGAAGGLAGDAPVAAFVPGVGPDADAEAATPAAPTIVPGPALAASVLGILYGSLLTAWVVGEAIGAPAAAFPSLGPRTASGPLSLAAWRVLISAGSLVLAIILVAASAGCFKLRPWARRLIVRYAVADLVFQVLVLLIVFAWAGPATVNAMMPRGAAASEVERAALEIHVYVAWVVRWLALSIFPAAVLALMTRRQVRQAFPERGRPS